MWKKKKSSQRQRYIKRPQKEEEDRKVLSEKLSRIFGALDFYKTLPAVDYEILSNDITSAYGVTNWDIFLKLSLKDFSDPPHLKIYAPELLELIDFINGFDHSKLLSIASNLRGQKISESDAEGIYKSFLRVINRVMVLLGHGVPIKSTPVEISNIRDVVLGAYEQYKQGRSIQRRRSYSDPEIPVLKVKHSIAKKRRSSFNTEKDIPAEEEHWIIPRDITNVAKKLKKPTPNRAEPDRSTQSTSSSSSSSLTHPSQQPGESPTRKVEYNKLSISHLDAKISNAGSQSARTLKKKPRNFQLPIYEENSLEKLFKSEFCENETLNQSQDDQPNPLQRVETENIRNRSINTRRSDPENTEKPSKRERIASGNKSKTSPSISKQHPKQPVKLNIPALKNPNSRWYELKLPNPMVTASPHDKTLIWDEKRQNIFEELYKYSEIESDEESTVTSSENHMVIPHSSPSTSEDKRKTNLKKDKSKLESSRATKVEELQSRKEENVKYTLNGSQPTNNKNRVELKREETRNLLNTSLSIQTNNKNRLELTMTLPNLPRKGNQNHNNNKLKEEKSVNSQMTSEVESICDELKLLVAIFEQSRCIEDIKGSQHYVGLISVVNKNLQQITGNK